MKITAKLGLIVIAQTNTNDDISEASKIINFYKDKFSNLPDSELITKNKLLSEEEEIIKETKRLETEGADLIVFALGSWIHSSLLISTANDMRLPFVVYGISEDVSNGSIGVSCMIRYVLEEMGKKFVFLSGRGDDVENYNFLIKYLKASHVIKYLKNKKIGIIGGKPMMMYQTQVDEFSWKLVFGVDFPQFDSTQIFHEMENNIDEKEAKKVEKNFLSKINKINWEYSTNEKISRDVIIEQAKMFLAFKRLKELNKIDIFANKCHPEMLSCKFGCGYGACLATSMLNDSGIVTACEADIPAALSMYILSILSSQTTFFGDIGSIDKEKNTITFFNCGTGPLSMADNKKNIELYPIPAFMGNTAVPNEYYMNKVKGACIHYDLKENQEVTLFRVGGNLNTIRFHTAKVKTIKREVRTKSHLDNVWPGHTVEFKDSINSFLNNTVGHHYILAYGDYIDELKNITDILGIKFILDG